MFREKNPRSHLSLPCQGPVNAPWQVFRNSEALVLFPPAIVQLSRVQQTSLPLARFPARLSGCGLQRSSAVQTRLYAPRNIFSLIVGDHHLFGQIIE